MIVRVTPRFNWQGPGHWSARRALEAVARLGADASRVAFTGHSNGAFGAWLLAALDPSTALACAPLSGMSSIGTVRFAPGKQVQCLQNCTKLKDLYVP